MVGKKGQRPTKAIAAVVRGRAKRKLKHYVPTRLKKMDGRTQDARFLKAAVIQLCEDLGGMNELSTVQRHMVGELAWQMARLQRLKAEQIRSGQFDDARYSAVLNSFNGLARTLGIERKARRVMSAQELIAKEVASV
jgi:hypothetical protein